MQSLTMGVYMAYRRPTASQMAHMKGQDTPRPPRTTTKAKSASQLAWIQGGFHEKWEPSTAGPPVRTGWRPWPANVVVFSGGRLNLNGICRAREIGFPGDRVD